MADIHQLPDIEEVEREASEWIARLHADDTSSEDRARFDAWRKAHPSHVRAYEEMSATWRQFMEAGPIVRAVAFGQALGATQLGAVQKTRPARWQWASAIAATVTIAVLCGWLWVAQPTPQTLFQTAIGEQASVELPDGSMLELNSNSRARIDYTEGARVIRLERGEAFFNVHHDALRPFWVVAGDSWVRAVGTAFNVQILSAGVRVTVSEGAIKVASAPAPRGEVPSDQRLAQVAVSALTAGQQVNVNGEASEVRSLPDAELTRLVAWRSGMLYFENQRLGDVVDELSRYTALKVVIEDEALRSLPVGGTFQANSQGAEALLTMLQDGFGLEARRDGSGRVTIVEPQ